MLMIKKLPGAKDYLVKTYKKLPAPLGNGIIIAAVLTLLVLGIWIWNLSPERPGSKELQLFKIQYGTSLREIAQQLKARGFIRSKLVYEAYVRVDFKNREAKAGWYRIGPGFSVPRLVRELHRGIPQAVKVTIPEGLTMNEIANLLANKNLINPKRFLALARDVNFVNGVLRDFKAGSSAEGYLFPDTYEFMIPVSEERIITAMLERFREVFRQNFNQLADSKQREIVIMASLVEMEARKAEERPVIAGVFYNRIRLGYRLESCATVQYVLGTHKHLYYKDLKVNSPYNTYIHDGLPPGPIANPGLASLRAAAHPQQVKYLYFVAKPDGSHIFSTDYREHLRAQKQADRLRVVSQTGNPGSAND
jgi:UPF0755 protein